MKKIKGFTLIECLVALAIIGIASLVMAEIYANVSRINRSNHNVNTSLSYQMAVVEKQTKTDAVPMYYGGGTTSTPDINAKDTNTDKKPPHKQGITASDLTKPNIVIKSSYKDKSGKKYTYSFPVDIYVLLSRDADNDPSMKYNTTSNKWVDNPDFNGDDEKNYNLRYKYILGHNN